MNIKDRLYNDVKDAMRARDKDKLGVLRLITAAVKQVEVDERIEVDEARMLVILDKLVKQRKESISQFQSAARDDLVAQEQFELDILNQYLPEPMSDSEITQLVEQALTDLSASKMSDMGRVMAQLKPLMQGRADMSLVSAMIKGKLA
ncbi:MAG: GatB/YqeY domain-containing protein [Legionellales bacterium]|nr:GatB/YqeY domain-containing protein [Legionellales bacterium]